MSQIQTKKKDRVKNARRRRPRGARRDDDDVIRISGNGNVVRNRGDYTFPLVHLLGPLFDMFAPLLGDHTQGEGRGDYKIKRNSLILAGTPPVISSDGKMDYHRIQHREWLQPVKSAASNGTSGSNYEVTSFQLNPGLPSLLPWGSGIADNYEEYEIMGMVVYFKPTSGNSTGANTTLGRVMIATNYNAGAPAFSNAQELLNSEYADECKPSNPLYHLIECEPHKNPISELYVRTGAVPAGEDVKTYDLGKLQVATQGCPTNSQELGDLWITYDIALYKPILNGISSGNTIPTDHFQLTAVSSGVPLGTSQVQTVGEGALGGTCNGVTGTIYSFPSRVTSGTFFAIFAAAGTAAAYTAPLLQSSFSFTVLQVWSTNAGPDNKTVLQAPAGGVSSALVMTSWLIQFNTSVTTPVQLTFGVAGSLPTATCYGDLMVTQVNSNFTSFLRNVKEITPDIIERMIENKAEKLVERIVQQRLGPPSTYCYPPTSN